MGNFTEIIPALWMGGQQIPIQPTGFDAIVNCKELEDFAVIGVPYLHLPMVDGPEHPDTWLLEVAARFIDGALDFAGKCLVHCAEGHNRSGITIAYYLIENKGYKLQDAIDLIRSKRPGALSNQVFVDYLLSL